MSADGSRLFIADESNNRIRVAQTALPEWSLTDFAVASEDGSEVYLFNSARRHLKTLEANTGVVRYLFGYDANGYLTSITDVAGKVTTIERTGATATAIVAPFGQRTVLSVNPDGWLTGLTDAAGLSRTMDYSADGLLQHFTDPLGHVHTFTYDDTGHDKRTSAPRLARTWRGPPVVAPTLRRSHPPGAGLPDVGAARSPQGHKRPAPR